MVAITFVTAAGDEIQTDVAEGLSLMEGARSANVPGILAECGGACACSTCHVYVAPDWVGKLPAREEMEGDMLDFAWEPDESTSRLACQVTISASLDGLRVSVPARQA